MSKGHLYVFIFGFVFLLSSGLAVYLALSSYRVIKARLFWYKASGIVRKITVTEKALTDGDVTVYYPNIEYQYVVDGISYFGKRAHFLANAYGFTDKQMRKLGFVNLKAGSNIQISFDPTNPSDSVISAKISYGVLIMILVFLLLAVCSEWALLLWFKEL
jgi:hypothetical protein